MRRNECITLHGRVFVSGPPWVDSLCHTPPLYGQPFLQNVPRRHEQDYKKACASLMSMMANGLLRWGSLTCCHVIGGTSNNIGHGWHLCSQWCLFNFLHCMGQRIFWSMYAYPTFFQFVHWVISCDEEWWSCLVSFHAMEQSHGISDQHMRVELWPNLGFEAG